MYLLLECLRRFGNMNACTSKINIKLKLGRLVNPAISGALNQRYLQAYLSLWRGTCDQERHVYVYNQTRQCHIAQIKKTSMKKGNNCSKFTIIYINRNILQIISDNFSDVQSNKILLISQYATQTIISIPRVLLSCVAMFVTSQMKSLQLFP